MAAPPSASRVVGDSSLSSVLDLIRTGGAATRPEIVRTSGLGRAVVSARVDELLAVGLIEEAEFGVSTGGRMPRRLRFRTEAGRLLTAVLGTAHLTVAITDLAGTILAHHGGSISTGMPPHEVMDLICSMAQQLQTTLPAEAPVCGIGIALPGPVDFHTGRPVGVPVMPNWEDVDVRGWFTDRYDAPVWIDNDLNLLVLSQWRAIDPAFRAAEDDIILVKVSYGVGAGILSGGHVHRGRNGAAGDIGHTPIPAAAGLVCRCGRVGCLEAVAGGWALVHEARERAEAGCSPFLSERLSRSGEITPNDISAGARRGDAQCVDLVTRSGALVGETLAVLIGFYNPAIVYVGGIIPDGGDHFMVALRQAVHQRTVPLATRNLKILPTSVDQLDALRGAATMVAEELLRPSRLPLWLSNTSPAADPSAFYSAL